VWTALRRYNAGATALREAAAAANGQPVPGTALARLRGPAEELSERLLLLKGLCKQQPNDRDGRLLLAYHYILAGRADDARASLDEAMRADPNDAAARFLARQLGPARS
jgi:cytochrome c-type biogenesis protein CcmH/NrfG